MQHLPDPALLVLVGPAGSGKSHFARAHYRGPEIVSSDDLRGVVGSGAHDLAATDEAFEILERVVAKWDLPDPAGPTRTTSAGSGKSSVTTESVAARG